MMAAGWRRWDNNSIPSHRICVKPTNSRCPMEKCSILFTTLIRAFFERKGLAKKATNCLNMSAQSHCKRFMAYDNCQRYFAAEACGSSTTTEGSGCVICYDPCPSWARHVSESESVLRVLRAHDRAAVPDAL